MIRVDFDPSKTNVVFRGVVYDSKVVSCSTTSLSKDGSPVMITPTTKEAAVKPFAVTCQRLASASSKGSQHFDRFVAALDTNHGTYTVELPTEDMLGYDLAAQNKIQREKLVSERDALIGEKERLEKSIANTTAPIVVFDRGQDFAPATAVVRTITQKGYAGKTNTL